MKSHIPPLVLGFILWIASPAIAETNYPDRTIRLLFGFPAGVDAGIRVIAEKLSEGLGRTVIVENITGAGGNLAADRTASATPDGHTIAMLTGANVVIRPLLHRKLPYDPHKELVPVSVAFRYANILVVNNDVPARSVAELVALARAAPGKLSYGHSGLGTTTHLLGELLNVRAGIQVQGVPYRGPTEVLADLMGGRISMTINPPGNTLALMQEGKVRALAVTSRTRTPFAPEIPTMVESGYPDFDTTVWFGLFVPARTPQPVVDRVSREMARIAALPDVQKRFFTLGWIPVGSTQAEFNELIKAETRYWAQLINDAGIRPID